MTAEVKSGGKRTVEALVDAQLRIIRQLTTDLQQRRPKDAQVARAHKRIMLAAQMDPLFVVEKVGHELQKYTKQIGSGDESFFEKTDFSEQLKKAATKEGAEERVALTKALVPMVREIFSTLPATERAVYWKKVRELLEAYLAMQEMQAAAELAKAEAEAEAEAAAATADDGSGDDSD